MGAETQDRAHPEIPPSVPGMSTEEFRELLEEPGERIEIFLGGMLVCRVRRGPFLAALACEGCLVARNKAHDLDDAERWDDAIREWRRWGAAETGTTK